MEFNFPPSSEKKLRVLFLFYSPEDVSAIVQQLLPRGFETIFEQVTIPQALESALK